MRQIIVNNFAVEKLSKFTLTNDGKNDLDDNDDLLLHYIRQSFNDLKINDVLRGAFSLYLNLLKFKSMQKGI